VPGVKVVRDLASRIPDARLSLLEGMSVVPWIGDTEAVVAAIDEFLGEGEETAAGPAPSGLVTILFTDMEGSTALTAVLTATWADDSSRQ
jgi:class 3 adenylate cyclase